MKEEIALGLHRIRAANPSPLTGSGTNSYLVGTGAALALIDPGPDLPPHREALLHALAPGQRISHILVTHPHRDHSALAMGLAVEIGAELLAFGTARDGLSPRMRELAEAGTIPAGEGADQAFYPARRLAHGDLVEGDGWQIEALHTPGHMASHLSFAFGDVLFSGDHVMGWSTSLVAPPEGDMAAYMTSLALLSARPWRVFLPGHGDLVTNPAARLAELTHHRRAREAAILAALSSGLCTVAEIAERVYTATPPAMMPAAERNVLAHLIDLVDRGEVTPSAPPGPGARFVRQ